MENLKTYDILYFSSSDCPPCKVSKPIVEKVTTENAINIKFITVDKDENGREHAAEYGVRSVPTIVFQKDGEDIGRKVGMVNEKEFIELLVSYDV